MKRNPAKRFVICVWNEEGETDLEVLKLYRLLPDKDAEKDRMIRVIDESGEDYLYPARYFVPVDLPKAVERAIEQAAELQPA
ncbi:MAG: hypothetical protein ACRD3D_13245 [Terriglobia bacterium]